MKKTFLVGVRAYRDVVVEAESAEEAEHIASEECHSFDWEIDDWTVEDELKDEQAVARAKKGGATDVYEF